MALSRNFFPHCERSHFTSVHNNTVTLVSRKYSHILGPVELRLHEAQGSFWPSDVHTFVLSQQLIVTNICWHNVRTKFYVNRFKITQRDLTHGNKNVLA
jgi:hypothetical protein